MACLNRSLEKVIRPILKFNRTLFSAVKTALYVSDQGWIREKPQFELRHLFIYLEIPDYIQNIATYMETRSAKMFEKMSIHACVGRIISTQRSHPS